MFGVIWSARTTRFVCFLILPVTVLILAWPAHAATFTVGDAAQLIEAMQAANDDSDADTIELTADIMLTDIAADAYQDTGLPSVTTRITILGNRYTIKRESEAEFRIFYVASQGFLSLDNVTISHGAVTEGDGGGINNGGVLILTDSTFSSNRAFNGGAIFNSGILSITRSAMENNTAEFGGGVMNVGMMNSVDTAFTANSASSSGGGIYNYEGGSATLVRNTVSANETDYGGGIVNVRGAVAIVDTVIADNSAMYNGGGIYNDHTLSIIDSTISDNGAGGDGGGLYNYPDGSAVVVHCTILGNSANFGGGVINFGVMQIVDSAISENIAQEAGGGIYGGDGGTVVLLRLTLAKNTGGACAGIGVMDGGGNIQDDDTC